MTAPNFTQSADQFFAPIGSTGMPDPAVSPMSAFHYMSAMGKVITDSVKQRPLVRIADKNLNIIAALTEEMSCTMEELIHDSGTAVYTVRYEHWLADWMVNLTTINEDLHLIIDPIPTMPDWRTRWGGKIQLINVKRNQDGTSTIELHAISMREHAKRLLIAANPIFPPEVQLPKMWMLPGPTRTVCFATFVINLARIFVPGLSTITNIFNPAGWINPLSPDAILNFDPFNWPIQVAFVNPVLDQSRWTVLGATWTDWHSSTLELLTDAGVILRAYTWLEEDVDSPHVELTDLVNLVNFIPGLGTSTDQALSQLIRPGRNCVVFSLEDFSGQTGPTGTALDGLLNLIGVTLDDLVTTILIDSDTGETLDGEPLVNVNGTTPVFESLLGVAPAPPKAIWRDGQYTGIVEVNNSFHKAPVKTVMTGGRSPSLVNELQTFGIKYGLSQLSAQINMAIAHDFGVIEQVPGSTGLEELYQGQLDNSLFAWERYTDPLRALWSGDLAFNEYIERGQGTAYTLAGILTLREANYKTRAYQGFQAVVRNGMPWRLDVDVRLGERAGFEYDGVIYVDQLTALRRTWDRKKPVLTAVSIGDDKDKQDPIARGMRALTAVYSLVGAFLGEGTLFG